jgi:hypothetical protein
MEHTPQQRGWHLHHHEQLFYKVTTGAPTVRFKFYHCPPYRQTVHLDQPPANCKLKTKGLNTFFLCQQKVHAKGVISLERELSVYPQPTTVTSRDTWGRISDIPHALQKKYAQSFTYWPVRSPAIRTIAEEHWFSTDDLSTWVHDMFRYISNRIKYPEKQEKRLGADQALLTGIGDCDEFTDLFITLSRIRGVPCRRLTGYFIPRAPEEAEPHAWGEILSPTLGWIPVDIALHNLGSHTMNYVIEKIEEFNPALPDYQVQRQTTAVHYHWERPLPVVTPLY